MPGHEIQRHAEVPAPALELERMVFAPRLWASADRHAPGARHHVLEIERLERLFAAPDIRPINASDLAAANRRHDEKLAHSPWFRLWRQYGLCCRPEPPVIQLGERDS